MAELALPETDRHGHLVRRADWTRQIGDQLASNDGLELTAAHWEVIDFVREHYESFQMAPPMRVLVRAMGERFGPEKGSSRYLYRLFSQSPARQACCYGGLPKPVGCL